MATSNDSAPAKPPVPSVEHLPCRDGTDTDAVARSRAPRWFVWLAWIALGGYAAFLAANMSAVAGGSDSSGYLNSARLFAEGKVRTELRVPAEFSGIELVRRHFSPAGFDSFPVHQDLAPAYPPGFPLHLALAGRLLGWRAGPFLLQLLAAVAAVWLCYRAARELGLHHTLAGAGAMMLAVFPVFIFTSVQTLSDTLATTWTLAALLFALRGRTSRGWAAATGAALAIGVLVRPTNVLLAPALVVWLGFDVRRLLWFVLGGIPGALWLGWHNHHVYGGALGSGYGDQSGAFGFEHVAPAAAHFAHWLALFLPPIVLVLPLAALAHRATRHRALLGLGLGVTMIIGFYLFCAFSYDAWTYLRYLLPGLPALLLAALLGVEALAGNFHTLVCRDGTECSLIGWASARAMISRLRAKPRGGFAISPHELGAHAEALQCGRPDTREDQLKYEKCGLAGRGGRRWPRAFRPAVALILTLWAAGNSWYWTRTLHTLYVPIHERAYEEAALLVRSQAPPNALVLCNHVSGSIYYYTDMPTLLFDTLGPGEFARYAALARNAGRPLYAAIFDIEEEDFLRNRCPGAWTRIGSAGNIGIWRLASISGH